MYVVSLFHSCWQKSYEPAGITLGTTLEHCDECKQFPLKMAVQRGRRSLYVVSHLRIHMNVR